MNLSKPDLVREFSNAVKKAGNPSKPNIGSDQGHPDKEVIALWEWLRDRLKTLSYIVVALWCCVAVVALAQWIT